MSAHRILITGASGLLGKQLRNSLISSGYDVITLSRTEDLAKRQYKWDIQHQYLDPRALDGVTAIYHLAGAGIADKRWSEARKQEILDSRVKSTELLANALRKGNHSVKTVICASAIGFYGFNDDSIKDEYSEPGNDFLAQVTIQWEDSAKQIEEQGIRVVKVRIGIVLSLQGGALREMIKPIRYFVGAPLGTGNQMMSWIHEKDLIALFMYVLNDIAFNGPVNAVSSTPVSNREFTKTAARYLHRPLFLPPVPGFVLKLILGEMASLILNGSRIVSARIPATKFKLKFDSLEVALKDLLGEQQQS